MSAQITLMGSCSRCGASRILINVRDRVGTLPTCDCKEETLRNMLNAISNVLERELNEPIYARVRQELNDFIEEFT